MKNIYQSVLDQAYEKRRQLTERGYQGSPRLLQKINEYRRTQEEKMLERLGDVKIVGVKKHE